MRIPLPAGWSWSNRRWNYRSFGDYLRRNLSKSWLSAWLLGWCIAEVLLGGHQWVIWFYFGMFVIDFAGLAAHWRRRIVPMQQAFDLLEQWGDPRAMRDSLVDQGCPEGPAAELTAAMYARDMETVIATIKLYHLKPWINEIQSEMKKREEEQ